MALNGRIRGFDGLRAVAVLLVFFYHKAPALGGGLGRLGVWLFFCISGFLITGILAGQRSRMESRGSTFRAELGRFLFRRSVRIFPIYYLLLLILTVLVLSGGMSAKYSEGLPYHFAYLSNIWIGSVLHQWAGGYSHFWSLAVEEQFYLLFAPLILITPRRWHLKACLSIVAICMLVFVLMWQFSGDDILIYTNPATNFWLLGLGGVGWWLVSDDRWRARLGNAITLAPVLAVIVLICAYERTWQASIDASTYSAVLVFYGVCVAVLVSGIAANGHGWMARVLEVKWLAALGRVSYGFYLYHAFVPDFAKGRRVKALFPDGDIPILVNAIGLAFCLFCTILLAQLSWRLIEAPILRLKDGWSNRAHALHATL